MTSSMQVLNTAHLYTYRNRFCCFSTNTNTQSKMAEIVDGSSPESEITEMDCRRTPSLLGRVSSSFKSIIVSIEDSFRESNERMEEEEIQLQWAAIERLPTFERLRSSLLNVDVGGGREATEKRVVDVAKLSHLERRLFVDNLIENIEEDNRRLLEKLKERIKKVDVKLPTIEVRFRDLSVEATCQVVHGKPVPTLWNSAKAALKGFVTVLGWKPEEVKRNILKDVSGIIKPSRMTLLLGPPACGKTTLLLALSGRLNQNLKATGEISYNGYRLKEFIPEKTAAYISQYDLHIPEMTVRETLDFSARCQGAGIRSDILKEVSTKEKLAGVVPDFQIDTYMKAISIEGLQRHLQTDYIMKILGLEICSDIMVGEARSRGISGGQKKRLTTGEIIVGPIRALFMDEISNGLDSSTTFQIISCIQQLVHIMEVTTIISLLQPAPETFNLFDDIIMMAEGKIIYHGPRSFVLDFFDYCGFRCPERKGIADFLQEVVSRKDQEQYWYKNEPYCYFTASQFQDSYKTYDMGRKLAVELSQPYDKCLSHKNALCHSRYTISKWEMFKACFDREYLLMKRSSFVYAFKTTQLVIVAVLMMTTFIRTKMDVDLTHATYYLGSFTYTIIRIVTTGIAELTISSTRFQIFNKQRDFHLYTAWAYAIPVGLLRIPFAVVDSFLWTALTYYTVGYSPEAERFFCQFLLLFALHQTSTSLFRFIASLSRTSFSSYIRGLVTLIIFCLFSGFILPRTSTPSWIQWGFWLSPFSYAEIGLTINEFHAPRWQSMITQNLTIGHQVLQNHGLDFEDYFYWLSVAALFGFTILCNIGFAIALTYMKHQGEAQGIISHEQLIPEEGSIEQLEGPPISSSTSERMPLAFQPLTIAFQNVQYFVDTPQEMREQGCTEKNLQLLHDINGVFLPGVLTALMGVSGAGKTTLMDVLCGRKTGGLIEGSITIGGYPKVQKTFARIFGYCEQNDIHSPQITVEESVAYSAWLRLPQHIDAETKVGFIKDVLEIIELDKIKHSLVGVPGVSGLSTEQRKRLTVAVEFVANPSIIFMDEPTTGLDARAAAVVMRAIKNIVVTGRTIVCTIHQPSIDVFESFDQLFLMKRGGKIIYSGQLGEKSSKLIDYFESISGVPKIKDNYNPATWMLEVTTPSVEHRLGVDFARTFKESPLYRDSIELVKQLSQPIEGSNDLHFNTRFPQNKWEQFKACLWKQHLSYWRSPSYNSARLAFILIVAIVFGVVYWQHGKKIKNEQDLFNIMGLMHLSILYLGASCCSTVIPIVSRERLVLYREKFAGMYSSGVFSLSLVVIEIPYILILSALYVVITYPAVGFYWSAYKIMWHFYAIFCTLLYYNYLGMLCMSVSPTPAIAAILASANYTILGLYTGFLIPRPRIPTWWIWLYYLSPVQWSLNALLTSQYGDVTKEIDAFGYSKEINAFMEEYYGFHHNQLGMVAVVLICFPIVFASLFSYFIGKANFERK